MLQTPMDKGDVPLKKRADASMKLTAELTLHCPSPEQGAPGPGTVLPNRSRTKPITWWIVKSQHTDIFAAQHPLHTVQNEPWHPTER